MLMGVNPKWISSAWGSRAIYLVALLQIHFRFNIFSGIFVQMSSPYIFSASLPPPSSEWTNVAMECNGKIPHQTGTHTLQNSHDPFQKVRGKMFSSSIGGIWTRSPRDKHVYRYIFFFIYSILHIDILHFFQRPAVSVSYNSIYR